MFRMALVRHGESAWNRENRFTGWTDIDLTETFAFVKLLGELGVKILNTTAGSPYYNPHIQRPEAYPPSDGYQPAHDPLIDVARQVRVVREVRAQAPADLIVVSSGLSYVQDHGEKLYRRSMYTFWKRTIAPPTMISRSASTGGGALNLR